LETVAFRLRPGEISPLIHLDDDGTYVILQCLRRLPGAAVRFVPAVRIEDEPNPIVTTADEQPSKYGHRPLTTLKFRVVVKNDPHNELTGRIKGWLSTNGLQLEKHSQVFLIVPRGCNAEYLGGNRLAVVVGNRRVEFALCRLATYQNRLAQDVARYLNGDLATLPISKYALPLYLTGLVVLPLGIPLLTLGGAIPALVGAGAMALNGAIAQNERWPVVLRASLCGCVTCLALLATFGLLLPAFWSAARP
jgi:hypothetical protein